MYVSRMSTSQHIFHQMMHEMNEERMNEERMNEDGGVKNLSIDAQVFARLLFMMDLLELTQNETAVSKDEFRTEDKL